MILTHLFIPLFSLSVTDKHLFYVMWMHFDEKYLISIFSWRAAKQNLVFVFTTSIIYFRCTLFKIELKFLKLLLYFRILGNEFTS